MLISPFLISGPFSWPRSHISQLFIQRHLSVMLSHHGLDHGLCKVLIPRRHEFCRWRIYYFYFPSQAKQRTKLFLLQSKSKMWLANMAKIWAWVLITFLDSYVGTTWWFQMQTHSYDKVMSESYKWVSNSLIIVMIFVCVFPLIILLLFCTLW